MEQVRLLLDVKLNLSKSSQIISLLNNQECRCVSIVGVGGVGKTLLAAQAFTVFASESTQEAYFINLVEIASPERMSRAIADVIGIVVNPFIPPFEQLMQVIQSRKMLLMLDNFEQLLPDGAVLVNAILERAPDCKIMLTSRERLKLKGEWSILLQGLDTGELSLQSEAAELFISTAQRINHDFVPSEGDVIQEICRGVEGMPLAIEMAASWTELYSCREILSRISYQVLQLSTWQRDVAERHRSLEAVFETTWSQLSNDERDILQRLSLFHGGFTLEGAQLVAQTAPSQIIYLQDKMLVHPQTADRLVVQEMVRQFAYDKLASDENRLLEARLRHAEYYVSWLKDHIERLKHHYTHNEIVEWTPEIENLREMWATMLWQHRADWYWECWESFFYFFNITSRFYEGESAFRSAMMTFNSGTTDEETSARRHSAIQCALFVFPQGRIAETSSLLFTPELMELRSSPHERERFEITNAQGMLYLVIGEPDSALASALMAKAALEKLDNQYNLPGAYLNIGRAQIILGDKESAYQNLVTALQLCREQGAEWGIGLVLVELALVAELNLRFAEARDYYQAVIRGVTSSWQFWNYPRALIGLGRVELIRGNLIEAVDTQASALETMKDNPSLGFHIDCFVEVALILQSVGDTPLALVLLEYCTSHPECFQPTRNRAMAYLAAIREETLNLDASAARNLFPIAKVDVAVLLLDYLLRAKANRE